MEVIGTAVGLFTFILLLNVIGHLRGMRESQRWRRQWDEEERRKR